MSRQANYIKFYLGNKHAALLLILTLLALAFGVQFTLVSPSVFLFGYALSSLHLSVASLVCWPLYRRFYTCAFDNDRIYGLRSPAPLVNSKGSCSWSKVAFVRYFNYCGLEFYLLQDAQKRDLLYLPTDVSDYKTFKKCARCFGGINHPLAKILESEKRISFLSFSFIQEKVIHRSYVFGGQVKLAPRGVGLPHARVALLKDGIIIEKAIANEKGEFYFNVISSPGLHGGKGAKIQKRSLRGSPFSKFCFFRRC